MNADEWESHWSTIKYSTIKLVITYFATKLFCYHFQLLLLSQTSPEPTTTMPSSVDKNVEGFLFPMIDPIVGAPNYESYAELHMKLNSN